MLWQQPFPKKSLRLPESFVSTSALPTVAEHSAPATSSPSDALRPALDRLVDDLDAHGVDSSGLRALRAELASLEEPPRFFGRVKRTVVDTLRQNWAHMLGEMHETVSLVATLKKSLAGGRTELTPAERSDLRAQVADLLRMAPAAGVFLALELFPIPGTGILTPWLLLRLGLLPSRWREAHVVHALRKEAAALRASRLSDEADAVERLVDEVEAGCKQREIAAHEASLLTQWDFDGNGRWDPDERAAYEAALDELVVVARDRSVERIWVLRHGSYVFGPFRLTELTDLDTDVEMLVCTGTDAPWVDFRHLRERLTAVSPRAAPEGPGPGDP